MSVAGRMLACPVCYEVVKDLNESVYVAVVGMCCTKTVGATAATNDRCVALSSV